MWREKIWQVWRQILCPKTCWLCALIRSGAAILPIWRPTANCLFASGDGLSFEKNHWLAPVWNNRNGPNAESAGSGTWASKKRQRDYPSFGWGAQYPSEKYQKQLKLYGLTPSMTDGGKPYQNARIERINGILKHEFGLLRNFENIHVLWSAVAEAIFIYNTYRIHTSLEYLTPDFVHHEW